MLLDHVAHLRETPELRHAKMVFGFECNLGCARSTCPLSTPAQDRATDEPTVVSWCRRFEAQHAIHTLQRNRVQDWAALSEGPNGTPGILTTNSSKEVMCTALNELLSQNRLVVWSKLVSISMDIADIMKELANEMRGFFIHVDPPASLHGKPRRTFSGKAGGETDDLIIALQLTVLTMQIFNRESKYARHHV